MLWHGVEKKKKISYHASKKSPDFLNMTLKCLWSVYVVSTRVSKQGLKLGFPSTGCFCRLSNALKVSGFILVDFLGAGRAPKCQARSGQALQPGTLPGRTAALRHAGTVNLQHDTSSSLHLGDLKMCVSGWSPDSY